MALYEMFKPLTRAWYALLLSRSSDVPRPRDAPEFRSGSLDPDRVLLLGNGPCNGWGVITHQLSLTGRLGPAISAQTGVACDVDYVGDEVMNMATATAWLGNRGLGIYDAVVVIIGMNDAVRLTSFREWERGLRRLLGHLTAGLRPGVRVKLAMVHSPRSAGPFRGPIALLGANHARRLNKRTMRVLEDYPSVDGFELLVPSRDPEERPGSAKIYAAWARGIAPVVAPDLTTERGSEARIPGVLESGRKEGSTWAGMGPMLEEQKSGGSQELKRIAAEARAEFGVDIAVVSLLDGDTLWYATPGTLPNSVPSELSFCQYTVEGKAPLVVPDARKDPRFATNPLLDIAHVQFYAGHPLQSANGDTIGTLCLLGATPRRESSVPLDTLRAYAMQAQDEIWRLEAAGVEADGVQTREVEAAETRSPSVSG